MKKVILLTLSTLLLLGKALEPKVMRTQNDHHQHYKNSSHVHNIQDEIISSTAEASTEVSVMISLQAISEVTSGENDGPDRISYLDNNRIQITQDIAQGRGEHLTTLLYMMNIQTNEKNLEKIQKSFDELIYLSHNDFIKKLKTLI